MNRSAELYAVLHRGKIRRHTLDTMKSCALRDLRVGRKSFGLSKPRFNKNSSLVKLKPLLVLARTMSAAQIEKTPKVFVYGIVDRGRMVPSTIAVRRATAAWQLREDRKLQPSKKVRRRFTKYAYVTTAYFGVAETMSA